MRNIHANELVKISGGADINADKNKVNFKDDTSLYGTVVVPPSANGQVAHLTVQVVENTFINKLLN